MIPPRRPELCVGAVTVLDGGLVLVRRDRPPGEGLWSLPGGRVEWHETMREALRREMLEETGLDVVPGELVGWVERVTADHHFVIFDFDAPVTGSAPPVAGDDAAAVAVVSGDELASLPLVDGLADFLAAHGVLARLG